MLPALRRALTCLADRTVPRFADFCLIYLTSGPLIVCAAAAHATGHGQRVVRLLSRAYRIRSSNRTSTVAQVIVTGRASIRNVIEVDRIPLRDNLVADLHRRLAARSALVVPVLDGARVVGAVSLGYAASGRSYSAKDLPAARSLAGRVAQALRFAGTRDARLRSAARPARQGTTLRRRVAARN